MIDRKKKQQDKRIWQRMGRELTALHDLILEISSDPEYNAVMTIGRWRKLNYAQARIDELREDAADRMFMLIPDAKLMDTFYPIDRQNLEIAINEFRDKMKEATP